MKAALFEFKAFIFAVILIVLAAPAMVFQAVMMNGIMLSGQDIKIAVAIVFFVLIIANLASRFSLSGLFMLQLSLIFFAYNFFTIVLLSSVTVGVTNAIGAFLYNYSLLLFVLPYYWLSHLISLTSSIKANYWLGMFAVLVLFTDLYGLLEFILNDYLLPIAAMERLVIGDYIKFDHVGGFIRVSSIFKSPLEFGIFNVLISGFVLSVLLSSRKGLFFWLVFLVSSLSVFITISRTAILMYLCNLFFLSAFYILMNKGMLALSKRAIGFWFLLLIFATINIFIIDLSQFVVASTNSTNLQIRLENWAELLSNLVAEPLALWFGLGIVQNGSFGDYHSVIIDNLYVGTLMTGGVFGLFMFMGICCITIFDAWRRINKYGATQKIIGFSYLSFFMVFMIGGLTENLMHIMFYPFIALLFLRLMPQNIVKTTGSI